MNKNKRKSKAAVADDKPTTQEASQVQNSAPEPTRLQFHFYLALTLVLTGVGLVTAYVAISTLKMTERSFQIDQQPYLIKAETVLLPTDVAGASVNMMFKNIGKSPARNVRIFSSTAIRHTPVSDGDVEQLEKTISQMAASKSRSSVQRQRSVAPTDGIFFTIDFSSAVPPKDFPKVQSGEIMLFVLGDVTYDDMFGKAHVTEFCNFHLSSDPKTWNLCTIHNDIR